MSTTVPFRNIGLELVRVTENTAQAAARWIGSGNRTAAKRIENTAKRVVRWPDIKQGWLERGKTPQYQGQTPLCAHCRRALNGATPGRRKFSPIRPLPPSPSPTIAPALQPECAERLRRRG